MANIQSSPSPGGPPLGRERRKAARVPCEIKVVVFTMRGPIPATMVDLSATGCRLKSSDLPAISVNVKISLIEHGLELRAERRWQNGELSGWRFVYNLKELERARKVLEEQQKRNRPASG